MNNVTETTFSYQLPTILVKASSDKAFGCFIAKAKIFLIKKKLKIQR
jgi:hypothetical protein